MACLGFVPGGFLVKGGLGSASCGRTGGVFKGWRVRCSAASSLKEDIREGMGMNDSKEASDSIDVREILDRRISEAMLRAFGDSAADADPMLTAATKEEFGDYQCNAAMSFAKKMKQKPRDVAAKIVEELQIADLCTEPQIAGPGFINLTLSTEFIQSKLRLMLNDKDRLGIEKKNPPQRIVVDFSSPNVAKEMHVGHLRSTIIGESICRLLEFLGHEVIRLNHIGDWGTQFGMLILYLKQVAPEVIKGEEVDLGDLVAFYKKAKVKFDENDEFKSNARKEVVELQAENEESMAAWRHLCEQSRKEFKKIYDELDITFEERGESFYNPYLKDVITSLQEQGLAVEDGGAQVVFLDGIANRDGSSQGLIVQKSDGGFMYSTTDLAAMRYRADVDRAERILYVTDVGQAFHFEQVFQVARRAGFVSDTVSLEHVPFGLVLGEDGKKFKTRSGATVKLKDLLDEAVSRAEADIVARLKAEDREESEEFIRSSSRKVGLSAVVYADLKTTRTSNYRFSFDKMLALQGNTAPYMLYAYARIQGINRKVGSEDLDLPSVDVVLDDISEKSLARHLIRLPRILAELEVELKPHTLCDYIFELSQKFNQFYERCSIANAESEELKRSRLALAQLTARVLKLSLHLLDIKPLERL
ncbi:hypothetical protein NDN08_004016 [Rhodosorus marinus]|uniref:arginine--tRNA ligase n=1 Tax=Rhodosorus marinus TaxID=101924 RepID=A0AAV8UME5_9RHOD|nr:hypothetical protein NDN08_004016 [Rhodosorus marinus]